MPILDNFNSQFINDVTETENGLMSPHDKTKLNNINLDDIKYIQDGLKEIAEYMVPQFIYGIKIDPTNSSVTYTDDAVGFTPLSVNQSTGVCNYGSWKNIINDVLGVKPCLVKRDGTVLTYLNPNDYTKTIDGNTVDIESGDFGQVLISFNHVYYKFSMHENKLWFQISNKRNDYTWIETAFCAEDGIGSVRDHMYIGSYECAQVNNILQSLSGKDPSFNLSFNEIDSLTSFGVFHMMNIIKKQFVIFLGYLVTKSIDLESKIGNGNIQSNTILKTGTMNTKGLFYGKNTTNEGVKLFGIENLWGNQLKYMNGLVQKLVYVLNKQEISSPEQHIYCKNFYPYDKIENFDDIKKIEPNKSGFISKIEFLTESIYFPSELNGSSTTFYKSFYQNGESMDSSDLLHAIYGGSNIYSYKAGPEFLLLANPDPENVQITTHLIY